MKTRALDVNYDFMFGQGLQSFVKEKDALKQNVSTRLKQWRGDCFFALTEGVDWNNYLDIGTKELLDLDIKRVILQTEGVLRIATYSSTLNHDTRGVSIESNIDTVFGTVTINQAV